MRKLPAVPALVGAIVVISGCGPFAATQKLDNKTTTQPAKATTGTLPKAVTPAKIDLSKAPAQRPATGVTIKGSVRAPKAFTPIHAGAAVAATAKRYLSDDTTDAPVANCDVFLADAAGDPLPDLPTVETDASGNYAIPNVPANFTYVVAARVHSGSSDQGELETLVKASPLGSSADISLASTLVSASVVDGLKGSLGELNPVAFKQAIRGVGPHCLDGGLPDVSDHAGLVRRMKGLSAQLSDVQSALDDMRQDLQDIKTSLDQLHQQVDELQNGQQTPPPTDEPWPNDSGYYPSDSPSYWPDGSASPYWEPSPYPTGDPNWYPTPGPSGDTYGSPYPYPPMPTPRWLPDGWGTTNPFCGTGYGNAGGLISNGGSNFKIAQVNGGVVANNGTGLVSNNAGGLIGNNGNIIAQGSGNLIQPMSTPTPLSLDGGSPVPVSDCGFQTAGPPSEHQFTAPSYYDQSQFPVKAEFYESQTSHLAYTLTFNHPGEAVKLMLPADVHYDILLEIQGGNLDNSATDVFVTDNAPYAMVLPF